MSNLAIAIAGPVATIAIALLGYFAARKLRNAQTARTDAETGKTEAEAWALLTGGLTARLAALEAENAALRHRVDVAESEARSCRRDLDDLRRQVDHPSEENSP